MDEGAVAGVLLCCAAGRQPAQEHCAAEFAETTDFLRRITVPIQGQGGSPCRTCVLIAIAFRMKITSGRLVGLDGHGEQQQEGESSVTGGARHVAASKNGGTRTESWSCRTARAAARRRCFGPALRRKVRARILCALTSFGSISRRGRQLCRHALRRSAGVEQI